MRCIFQLKLGSAQTYAHTFVKEVEFGTLKRCYGSLVRWDNVKNRNSNYSPLPTATGHNRLKPSPNSAEFPRISMELLLQNIYIYYVLSTEQC